MDQKDINSHFGHHHSICEASFEHTSWHHHCNNEEAPKFLRSITSESGEILTKKPSLDWVYQETHHPSNLSTAFKATHTTAAVARDKNKRTLIMRFHTVTVYLAGPLHLCHYVHVYNTIINIYKGYTKASLALHATHERKTRLTSFY